jgi:hypothetical protein
MAKRSGDLEPMDNINKLRSEDERDVPANKRVERTELLEAADMLDKMRALHMDEDTEEVAQIRFETTGKRRNYGEERRDIIKFTDILETRLDQYFAGG